MKFPYRVIKNNILYKAGEEVPDDDEVVVKNEEVKAEAEVEEVHEEEAHEEEATEAESEEVKEEHTYTRTEINRMNTASLHDLAKEIGIEGEEEKSGAQLKVEIIKKLNV